MKNLTYDVYGIGNALVDMEFRVMPEFLIKNKIDKGHMTLVPLEKQDELLMMLNGSFTKKASGGSAANTLVAVSQLGGKSFYSCKIASDETGNFFHKDLELCGVQSNCVEEAHHGVTGKCLVMVTPDAERTMTTYLGISGDFGVKELSYDHLISSKYYYIEGYLATSETAMEAALLGKKWAIENNVKTSLTLSDPAIVEHFYAQLHKLVGVDGIDLLFCNEKEAFKFCKTDSIEVAKEELKKYAKTFVITLGARGALVYDGTDFVEVKGHETTAIDSNGAGDMFAGAFLYGITNGYSYEASAKMANRLAAQVVSQFGPRLVCEEPKKILAELL